MDKNKALINLEHNYVLAKFIDTLLSTGKPFKPTVTKGVGDAVVRIFQAEFNQWLRSRLESLTSSGSISNQVRPSESSVFTNEELNILKTIALQVKSKSNPSASVTPSKFSTAPAPQSKSQARRITALTRGQEAVLLDAGGVNHPEAHSGAMVMIERVDENGNYEVYLKNNPHIRFGVMADQLTIPSKKGE